MNLNIANIQMMPSAADGRGPSAGKAGDGSFAAIMGAARQKHAAKSMFMQPVQSQTPGQNRTADFQTCLNELRSAFLAKGKPFSQVYVNGDDAQVLVDFLNRCGFGPEAGRELVEGLLANSPEGRISMSRFLARVKAVGAPSEKEKQKVVLDASVAPYVESMLNAFNLTEDEISGIMNRGRRKNGGLDLGKVIEGIKAAEPGAMAAGRGTIDPDASPQAVETLEQLGMKMSAGKNAEQITIADLTRTLERAEQLAGDGRGHTLRSLNIEDWKGLNSRAANEQGHLFSEAAGKPGVPAEVNEAITDILAKATTDGKVKGDLTDIITSSKIQFDEPGEKSLATGREGESEKPKTTSNAQASATASQGEGEKSSGNLFNNAAKPAAEVFDGAELNDFKGSRTLESRPAGGIFEPSTDTNHAKAAAGSAQGLEQRTQQAGNALPKYVIGQLGSQIERSLARGDGIVRMRLKPAELGSVRLEMQVTENRMNISVAAENGTVRELLLSNLQELKDLLQGQGIRLEKLDVNVGGDFSRTFSNLNEGAHNGSSNQGQGARGSFFDNDDNQDASHEPGTRTRQDTMVDLVA